MDDAAAGQTEDNEVGKLGVEQRAQLADLYGFANNEAKFFQSLSQKGPNVSFAVGDTDARGDFSPAERGELGSFVDSLVVHDALHHHSKRRCTVQ